MRILFDQGTPAPLRKELKQHSIETAFELGWGQLENGDLIAQAESKGFDGFITTDKNLKYQQNLSGRNMPIFVLSTTSWPKIREQVHKIQNALENYSLGGFTEIEIE